LPATLGLPRNASERTGSVWTRAAGRGAGDGAETAAAADDSAAS
jgi:hypothetical protein